MAGLLKRG